MATELELVDGWTERIIVELNADGAVIDLTGMTVQLQLYTRAGSLLTLTGTSGVVAGSAASGLVYFDPGANDLKATQSPHSARWKITDGSSKVAMVPNGRPDIWTVRLP